MGGSERREEKRLKKECKRLRSFLRQCAGEISKFVNYATNLLLFGSKHCCFDLNTKMPSVSVFSRRLLWKRAKTVANLLIW